MQIKQSLPLVDQSIKQLVFKNNDRYYSILKPEEIDRDIFIHLRAQLIDWGCSKDEVVPLAKRLCMETLQIQNEEEYLRYVMKNTYLKCKQNIKFGYNLCPIQDIQNPVYSHLNLFSSIYGFEIDLLKSKGLYSGIADIGCGEGIFLKLAKECNIESEGFDIKKSICYDDVKINLIEDFYEINKPFQCIILNHVLEHVQLRPDYYLKLLIDHFLGNFQNSELKVILISLPMHFHIASHLASNHNWLCSDEVYIEKEFRDIILQNGLKIFHPFKAFSYLAKVYDYKLVVNNQIGLYVLER
jgi:hypothetical protein